MGEAKRGCFVHFENRQEIKCHIPISLFFACGKRIRMPVNKGLNADFRVWKTFEVQYSAAKKLGFRAVHIVSLPTAKPGGTSAWISCTLALTDEKTIFLIDSFSVL